MAYVNTKFVNIENFLKTFITALYADLVTKQFELERKILIQKLSLATEFAYAMGEGPGYTAMKAGGIIYLLKCTPVELTFILNKPASMATRYILWHQKLMFCKLWN